MVFTDFICFHVLYRYNVGECKIPHRSNFSDSIAAAEERGVSGKVLQTADRLRVSDFQPDKIVEQSWCELLAYRTFLELECSRLKSRILAIVPGIGLLLFILMKVPKVYKYN